MKENERMRQREREGKKENRRGRVGERGRDVRLRL